MALIQCKECGEMISDKALACPKCGSPTEYAHVQDTKGKETKKKNLRTVITIFLIILLLGIIVTSVAWLANQAWKLNFYRGVKWDAITVVSALCIGFVLLSYLTARNKTRAWKLSFSILSVVFICGTITYIIYYNVAELKPIYEFQTRYCNENIEKNLNGKPFQWDDMTIRLNDKKLYFTGNGKSFSLDIDSISRDGVIFAECSCEHLAELFGDKLNHFFITQKIDYSKYQSNKSNNGFRIVPRENDKGFQIYYYGVFAVYPKAHYSPTYSSYNGMKIASGVNVSYDNVGAGWYEIKSYGAYETLSLIE